MERRQRSLPSRHGKGKQRPRRHRRDHVQTRCYSQAPSRIARVSRKTQTCPHTCSATAATDPRSFAQSRRSIPRHDRPKSRPQGCSGVREAGVKAIAGRKRPLGSKERERSQRAIAKPQAALEEAEWEHEEGRELSTPTAMLSKKNHKLRMPSGRKRGSRRHCGGLGTRKITVLPRSGPRFGVGASGGPSQHLCKKKSDDLLKLLAAFSIFLASPSATGAPIGLRD